MSKDPRQDYLQEEIRSLETSVKEVSGKVSDLDKTLAEYKVSFDFHVDVDQNMYAELKRMNDILASNTDSLKDHMRRTELLEEMVLNMNTKLTTLEVKNIGDEAIKEWLKSRILLAAKILGGFGAAVTVIAMFPKLITWLAHLLGIM